MSEIVVDGDAIPSDLKERDQWLMWDASADAPRRPHWRGDFAVSWTDPDDWHSFSEALEASQEREAWGIGYVFSNTNDDHAPGVYGALDLDGCADASGKPKDWLPSLEPFFNAGAYMEFSPSGEGIHIPLVGFEPPEWWRDVHFTADEHEGVEAYGKKFFTFTGDALRGAGDEVADTGEFVEDWLIEAHKAVTGDDPTEEQSADFEDASDGGRANRGEFLDEDDVREALEHVNPDVDYNTWRDIGFALADFFSSDHTALSVFEDWSRRGSKWDGDAEKQAARIIEGASSGGGRTIGTIVHHAREGGWDMPTPSGSKESRPVPPAPDDRGDDDDEARPFTMNWDNVRSEYEAANDSGRQWAAALLEERAAWMYVMESETLWVYDDETGYFNPWGEERVKKLLRENLGRHFSRSEAAEVVARIEAGNQVHRDDLNAKTRDAPLVCVGNGVLNLETGKVTDHGPEYRFTRGIPHDYDPEAVPELTLRFLREVTKRDEDMWTLLQQLGHGLMPGHPFKAFVVMFGPGDNGKSAVGRLFRRFVGDENAAAVELRDFREDDFATGDLPGKMVNVGDDLSGKKVRDVSMLKRLTGGDTLRANQKHQPTFDFANEAAMFFSGNEPPVFEEKTDALKGRLYPVHMPYRFTQEPDDGNREADPRLVEKILSDDEEMSGLLSLAIQGAQSLIETGGGFAMPEGPDDRMAMYEAASDPIRRFVMDYMEQGDSNAQVLKDDVYDVYAAMCRAQDERATSADAFKREISQQAVVDLESARTRALVDDENAHRCWRYARFSEDARQHMSARLQERYFPDGERTDTGREDGEDDADEAAPWNASPVSKVAQDPTGYATVTVEVLTVNHADNENAPAWKATVKDETSAVDVVSWENPKAPEEGDFLAIKNAELGEYDGKTQLTVRPGVTELVPIQEGVGHTEGVAPSDDDQEQLDASDSDDPDTDPDAGAGETGDAGDSKDTTDDGGDGDDEDPETASDGGTDASEGDAEGGRSRPDGTEGVRADMDDLVGVLEQRGVAMTESDLVVAVSMDADLMPPSRAEDAFEKARTEGRIYDTGDGFLPT